MTIVKINVIYDNSKKELNFLKFNTQDRRNRYSRYGSCRATFSAQWNLLITSTQGTGQKWSLCMCDRYTQVGYNVGSLVGTIKGAIICKWQLYTVAVLAGSTVFISFLWKMSYHFLAGIDAVGIGNEIRVIE